jgi:hypothetical protein
MKASEPPRERGRGVDGEAPDTQGGQDPAPPAGSSPVRCDICGGPMLDRHCRLVCLRCGYERDCSDP